MDSGNGNKLAEYGFEWETPEGRTKREVRQFLSIPNTFAGRVFLRMLKRYANRTTYRIVVRGRTPRWYVRRWNRFASWMVGEEGRKPQWVTKWAREQWRTGKLFIRLTGFTPIKHSRRLGVYFEPRNKRRGR